MKRSIWIALIGGLAVLVLLFLVDSMRSYDSLQEAVQSEWDTPVEVVNHDEELEVVYYLDGSQHVVDVYQHEVGSYRYNKRQSTGLSFGSNGDILPFYVQAHHFKGAGNVIYGAIKTDKQDVEKFVIQYSNGESQEITATNNTFIIEFPEHLNPDIIMFQNEIDHVIAYDHQGNVIQRYS